jgi:hypothetical protein
MQIDYAHPPKGFCPIYAVAALASGYMNMPPRHPSTKIKEAA